MKKMIILIYGDDIYYQAKLCVGIDFCDSTLEELKRAEWESTIFSTYLNYVRISLIK